MKVCLQCQIWAPPPGVAVKKEEENQEKAGEKEKIGKKRENREGFFTLPLLTDRAGYASAPPHTDTRAGYASAPPPHTDTKLCRIFS